MRALLPAFALWVLLFAGPAPASDAASECDRLAAHPFDPRRPADIAGVPIEALDAAAATAACERALAEQPDNAHLQFQLARGRYKAERRDEALALIERAAAQGYPAAERNLGYLYYRGIIVAQDEAAAYRWFRRAAEQGHALAQHDLGKMYERGDGTARDFAQAVVWYRRSAEGMFTRAQHALAYMYQTGSGVPMDRVEALKWFTIAANLGDAYAGRIGLLATLGMPPGDVARAVRGARVWLAEHRR